MKRAKNRRLMGQMNVVPYIDVMLVLLIIFMITAPMLEQGITVDLPQVEAAQLDPEEMRENEPLIISIDRDGEYFLNLGEDPEAAIDVARVRDVTAAVLDRNPATRVFVKADENVVYGRVALALALAQEAGATNIGMVTRSPDMPDEEAGAE